ncbi:MAG: VTT domain-containing protein [Chloroflexi bacterium]|nr:VTT domain-containing protein [Chloroflexota bacterium]
MSTAAVPTAPTKPAADLLSRLRCLLPLLASVAITLIAAPAAMLIAQHADRLSQHGLLAYPIIFVVQTLTSATLFLPAPGAAVAAAAGTFLDPFWVGVVAGLGSASGELSGYLLGYFGRRAVPADSSRLWRLAERGFRSWGFVALITLALIPNPVFDALGLLAGWMRYPVGKFWLATALGKVVKFYLFAYGGAMLAAWMRAAP